MYRYTATKCHYVLNDMNLDVYGFFFFFFFTVGWFVNRITQKLQNGFPQNSD